MNKLYEIFFQYSMLYVQRTDKKDEIAIPQQDIMHFLKFYEILKDSQNVFSFMEYYGLDDKRNQSPAVSKLPNLRALKFSPPPSDLHRSRERLQVPAVHLHRDEGDGVPIDDESDERWRE